MKSGTATELWIERNMIATSATIWLEPMTDFKEVSLMEGKL
jgi:hypothetical protein